MLMDNASQYNGYMFHNRYYRRIVKLLSHELVPCSNKRTSFIERGATPPSDDCCCVADGKAVKCMV